MPSFNEYKNESGYFIRAWTPETENITYQILTEGNPIIKDYGVEDGDEVSWDLIRSLKALGLISTKKSGVISPDDDFEPDHEEVDVNSLSEKEAYDLLEALQSHQEISPDKLDEICDILDVEIPETTEEKLERALEDNISVANFETFPTDLTLNGDDSESTLSVDVQDVRDDNQTPHLYRMGIFLLGDVDRAEPGMARHDVVVCQEHGVEIWNFVVSGELSWQKHAEMAQQKSCLLPVLIEWLGELDVNVGTPSENFGTEMKEIWG